MTWFVCQRGDECGEALDPINASTQHEQLAVAYVCMKHGKNKTDVKWDSFEASKERENEEAEFDNCFEALIKSLQEDNAGTRLIKAGALHEIHCHQGASGGQSGSQGGQQQQQQGQQGQQSQQQQQAVAAAAVRVGKNSSSNTNSVSSTNNATNDNSSNNVTARVKTESSSVKAKGMDCRRRVEVEISELRGGAGSWKFVSIFFHSTLF
ncbi:hypothetical protein BJ741DRAFT_648631 [Chytriomyces cf. hyalinus JEL632]|nr:hypothetical protein BJ741DRAFT_648631 [Chytriomyces cf. hyalinus JEL632]